MTAGDARIASEAADIAFKSWKNTTAKERSKVILKMASLMEHYKKDLATLVTLEAGKPTAEALGEVNYAISFYELYSEECKRVTGEILQTGVRGRRPLAIHQPCGPAALITPWNFPLAMVTRKVGRYARCCAIV